MCTCVIMFVPEDNLHPMFPADELDSGSVFYTQQAAAHHMTPKASYLPVKDTRQHLMNARKHYTLKGIKADTI